MFKHGNPFSKEPAIISLQCMNALQIYHIIRKIYVSSMNFSSIQSSILLLLIYIKAIEIIPRNKVNLIINIIIIIM